MRKKLKFALSLLLAVLIVVGSVLYIISCASPATGSSNGTDAFINNTNAALPALTTAAPPAPTTAGSTPGTAIVETDIDMTPSLPAPVKNGDVSAADGTSSPYSISRPSDSVVSMVQSTSVTKAADLTQDDISALVDQAVALIGGIGSVVKDGDTVVLKPNLTMMTDECLPGGGGYPLSPEVNGDTTDYRVVRAVAQLVRTVDPSGTIYVMEGSGGCSTVQAFQALNYTQQYIPEVDAFIAIENDSGAWQDTSSPQLVNVLMKDAQYLQNLYYNKRYFDADVFISIPTLKNHNNATVTGAVKNMAIGGTPANIYGNGNSADETGRWNTIPHDCLEYHEHMADFYAGRPADLAIMDGLQGLDHGPTPSYGDGGITSITDCQKNMCMVLASRDAVAMDTTECTIMNWDYKTAQYLDFLDTRGVGWTSIQNITLVGNVTVDQVRRDFGGTPPAYSGSPLTAAQKAPPSVSNASLSVSGGTLSEQYSVSSNVVKAEVYIGGKLVQIIKNSPNGSFTLDTSAFTGAGPQKVMVRFYTQYMSNADYTQTVTF